jgi:hypothetical protein
MLRPLKGVCLSQVAPPPSMGEGRREVLRLGMGRLLDMIVQRMEEAAAGVFDETHKTDRQTGGVMDGQPSAHVLPADIARHKAPTDRQMDGWIDGRTD